MTRGGKFGSCGSMKAHQPIALMIGMLGLGVAAMVMGSALAGPPQKGTVVGPEDESKTINVTVWLNLHNKAG